MPYNNNRRPGGRNTNKYRSYGGGGASRNRSRKRFGTTIDPARFVKAAKPVESTDYQPKNAFMDFKVSELLKNNMVHKNFSSPTQVQDKAIPLALQGGDVVGIANTGTGKTIAFLLPLLHKLIENRGEKVIIMAPTRELALQIEQECKWLAKGSNLLGVLLIGGVPIGPQLRTLNQNPEIIIGTPGRIKDHIERGSLGLSDVHSVVLDEVDRMLDMGFIDDIRTILSELSDDRQSLFFSATMNRTIQDLIAQFSRGAQTVMA